MRLTNAQVAMLIKENELLRQSVEWYRAMTHPEAIAKSPSKDYRTSCAVMVEEQDRWLSDINKFMLDTHDTLKAQIRNYRREVRRLNKQVQFTRKDRPTPAPAPTQADIFAEAVREGLTAPIRVGVQERLTLPTAYEVTDGFGRQFVTRDGGATWKERMPTEMLGD